MLSTFQVGPKATKNIPQFACPSHDSCFIIYSQDRLEDTWRNMILNDNYPSQFSAVGSHLLYIAFNIYYKAWKEWKILNKVTRLHYLKEEGWSSPHFITPKPQLLAAFLNNLWDTEMAVYLYGPVGKSGDKNWQPSVLTRPFSKRASEPSVRLSQMNHVSF